MEQQIDQAIPYVVGLGKVGLVTMAAYLWKIYHTVATKAEIAAVRGEAKEQEREAKDREQRLHDRIDRLREESRTGDKENTEQIRQDINALRSDLRGDIDKHFGRLENQLSEIRSAQLKRNGP